MAETKRRLFAAFKLSRKLVLVAGGALFLLGASGTAALVLAGPAGFIGDAVVRPGHCSTVYQASFERAGENRLIAIIRSSDRKPTDRIATGIRLAQHLANTERPDLVTVQVANIEGPESRAQLRGATIGAEVVYAPNPNRSRATASVWEVRYVDDLPTEHGYFFGPRLDMAPQAIEIALTSLPAVKGCDGDVFAQTAAHEVVGEQLLADNRR